jgi:hypothetical protein
MGLDQKRRFSISRTIQGILAWGMVYFAGCVAASLTLGVTIAVKGLLMGEGTGISIGQVVPTALFLSFTSLPPMLVFALPGFIILTLGIIMLRRASLFTYIFGWALNAVAAISVLALMGGHLVGSGKVQSMFFLFAFAGGVGGAVAWVTKSMIPKEDGAAVI